jgi:hypothetical protein
MPQQTKPRSNMASRSKARTAQGLRLMGAFRKLKGVLDREQVVALAERLLKMQNAKSK